MGLRKAASYSKKQITPFTRKSQKVKHLNYIKAVPNQKVTKFNMANVTKRLNGEFKCSISICSLMKLQIRDMALEAARQSLNNRLTKLMTEENYALECKPYPHQVIRENKTL